MSAADGTRRVGVGLIGYGVSGATFHTPLIAAEPRLRLVAVSTSPMDRAQRDLPEITVTDRPEDVINHPDVELVVVAAPNASHHELASAALRAGKDVVVDKPFTVVSADADALIELGIRQARLLSVFHNRRWDADFQTIRACINSGVLGEVRSYAARFDRYVPAIRTGWRELPIDGSGVLYDLGAHLIDQALVLFGPPRWVWGSVQTQRAGGLVPDAFHVVLGYDRLEAVLHASSLVRKPGPRYEVHGDSGSFLKGGIDTQEATLKAGGRPGDLGWGIDPDDGQLAYGLGGLDVSARVTSVKGSYEAYYAGVVASIIDGSPLPVSASEGRDVVRVIELVLDSERTGSRIGWDG